MRSMSVHSAASCETRIIIPVRNGGERWREAAAALRGAVPDPPWLRSLIQVRPTAVMR